jgi:putative nucleotidyltransferase with HDIG domain
MIDISAPSSGPVAAPADVATGPDAPNRNGAHAPCQQALKEALGAHQDTITEVIATLVSAIEMRDRYMHGHAIREAGYAVALAKEMGLPGKQIEEIKRGALLHDIGRIFISRRTLNKPDELTYDEFEEIKKHAAWGASVIAKVTALKDVAKIVRHHHERFDGGGYPDGLADDHIPLGARVVTVADAFGAMTRESPYRGMMTLEEALAELKRGANGQFDPDVVEAFLRLAERRVSESPMAQDGSLLLAEVVIDGTLTYEPSGG